jgi:transmembrane sensor
MNENKIPDSICEAIVSYFENSLSDEQAGVLKNWIREGKNNLIMFHEMECIYNASSVLNTKSQDISRAYDSVLERIKINDIRPLPLKRISITVSMLSKIAASILILVGLGIGVYLIFIKSGVMVSSNYFEAVAPKGSRSVTTLLDGSTVWLNSGTKLKYSPDFGKTTRDLILEGEAYFSVAENKKIPFRVITKELCISAVGTSFNVKAYADEGIIETTLESGEVKIERIISPGKISDANIIVLKPNQKAVFLKGSEDLKLIKDQDEKLLKGKVNAPDKRRLAIKVDTLVDTKLTTSWKDSKWIFKKTCLNEMVPILERRYDVIISFSDTILSRYMFTGTIKEETIGQVISALCTAAPIKYVIDHNRVILSEDIEKKKKYNKPAE